MEPRRVYLDYNATAPLLPAARDAICAALDGGFGNASSGHWAGRAAHALVTEARAEVAALVAAEPDQVVFTSGATEAITQVVWSAGPGRVVASAVEHPAVVGALANLGSRDLDQVPMPPHRPIDPDAVLARVDDGPPPALVAVMAANNVTGILNPVEALIEPLRERGVPLLVDAVQRAGKLPITLAPDYLVVTGHKIGGPKGVGALIRRPGAPLRPMFVGGGQERGHRAGTEPVHLIAGFGAAARAVREGLPAMAARYRRLRDRLEAGLLAALPGAFTVGAEAPRLPNTLNLVLPEGAWAFALSDALDARGLALSAGSACHARATQPAEVLLATGLSPDEALRALRLSVGHGTSEADIDAALAILPEVVRAATA
ncbi:MAG: hypothetical protein CSA66_01890 [Proteobacteria bacterium]|nr:MAG: hypothetical protein CSA66_01890 [Pseudomonadota bacterium]